MSRFLHNIVISSNKSNLLVCSETGPSSIRGAYSPKPRADSIAMRVVRAGRASVRTFLRALAPHKWGNEPRGLGSFLAFIGCIMHPVRCRYTMHHCCPNKMVNCDQSATSTFVEYCARDKFPPSPSVRLQASGNLPRDRSCAYHVFTESWDKCRYQTPYFQRVALGSRRLRAPRCGRCATARIRSQSKPSLPSRIAVIGNYLPRQCGIATFTTDLCSAISAEYGTARLLALPVNDTEAGIRLSCAGAMVARPGRRQVVRGSRRVPELQQHRHGVPAARVWNFRRSRRKPYSASAARP